MIYIFKRAHRWSPLFFFVPQVEKYRLLTIAITLSQSYHKIKQRERVVYVQSILIVESSDILCNELEKELRKNYLVYRCAQGDEGLRLQDELHPDGLILNLILPCIDGLYFLEHMTAPHPKAIITLSSVYPAHIQQHLMDLGVHYPILVPCSIYAVAHRMRAILENTKEILCVSRQEIIASHLRKLGVPRRGGYEDLRVGIPLFAQDPTQSMIKEFYPAVAVLRGRANWKQVEKAIRDVKEHAFSHRNDIIWNEYFSDIDKCPTNRQFISTLADFLRK